MTNFHEIQYGHNVTTDTPTSCIPKIGHDKLRLLLSCSDLGCQFCQCLCTLAQPRRYVQLQGCCGREQRYLFRLNTGHDCLAAHLYRIKVLSYNHCSILLLLVFSPWAGLVRDQSSVRRLVWLWYAVSWASS